MTLKETVRICFLKVRHLLITALVRKARNQANELTRERDSLLKQLETARNEARESQRELANARQSVIEQKQSLEHRLDEERRAKERTRAQLDARMEELQRRKSKFACM